MVNVLLIGNGAREHVVAETLKKNSDVKLYSYMQSRNPGIDSLSEEVEIGDYDDFELIKKFASSLNLDFAFVGPEGPLSNGMADLLEELSIPTVGPRKELAKLESSKSFTRILVEENGIEGNPKFMIFDNNNLKEASEFMDTLSGIVIKPDGLTGGKGVQVQGDHFQTKEEAIKYCEDVLVKHPHVVVEDKLDGEEFSFMCFTDGRTVLPMPLVQDHKRALKGDKGPNTGGMGSYSCADHSLPFLKKEDVDTALKINKEVVEAIHKKTGQFFRGIIYGGFIITKDGVKLIEYNARFGDPEVMNVLPLLKTDFVDVCKAIIDHKLDGINLEFENKATVCKYIVPEGYPASPVKDEMITIGEIPKNAKIYYSSVDKREGGIFMTSSRAVAVVGIADNIEESEKFSEQAVSCVKGRVFHRFDIGTKELIQKRIDHMESLGRK
tara:strand:- start:4246 stop:5562 length:1317 start_codon:yes stop_codon:yes gene_type:complete